MKKLAAILICIPFLAQSQTVVKRQIVSLANPYATEMMAFPIGFNVREDGNLCFYWSQFVKGTLKDSKKEDRKIGTLINNLFDYNNQELISGLPMLNETVYDSALKFISVSNSLVSSVALDKTQEYFFNGKPISKDITDLPSIFAKFPYTVNKYTIKSAQLLYTGSGVLGEKDKKYYPSFYQRGFTFSSTATPSWAKNEAAPGKKENQLALEGLALKKSSKTILLPGVERVQSLFFSAKDPDKYAEFKNYQFITWDNKGNIINRETVNLPYAYDPEGLAIVDENKQGVGFFYLCKRAVEAKKALSPDENSYYILHFDANGKLMASFETKLGTEENKADIITAFSNKGVTWFLAQDHQKKAEKIIIYKVSSTLEKAGEFTTASLGTDKEIFKNFWSDVQWEISKTGNLYFIGQGIEKTKAFGLKIVAPMGVYFMSLSTDFSTVVTNKINFTDPYFDMKELSIDVIDEQNENLNITLFSSNRSMAMASIGPKKSSQLTVLYSPGHTIYPDLNHFYDAASKTMYVITFLVADSKKGEIIKLKF